MIPVSPRNAFGALLILVSLLTIPYAAANERPPELNQAQLLIFKGDHLRRIPEGGTVVYDFRRRATGEPEKADEVRMTVTRVRDDDLRDLSFEFLSGADRLAFPPAEGYRGNPVAIQFLERDIRDMSQATGGSIGYFRNRIRKSFDDPQIEKTRMSVDGAEVDAVEIRVSPFVKDPNVDRLEGYAEKQYLFAYSEQVPGGLISIRTRMSSDGGELLEEELRYKQMTGAH